jgi:quercetin dioxygenase-like cupin family protein
MKSVHALLITLAALILIWGCTQQQEVVEDIVAAYPDHTDVVLDNDYVKAVEFTLQPGDKLPMHEGRPRAVFALSDYAIRWTEGGEISEKTWQQGDVHWHEDTNHAIENIGDTEARYLVVARKDSVLPSDEGYELASDASQVDTLHSSLLLDNEFVRVIEVSLPAGASQPMHDGINRLVYSLSDYTITYTSGNMRSNEVQTAAGTAHWHNADEHAVENTGETDAHWVIFEFKK